MENASWEDKMEELIRKRSFSSMDSLIPFVMLKTELSFGKTGSLLLLLNREIPIMLEFVHPIVSSGLRGMNLVRSNLSTMRQFANINTCVLGKNFQSLKVGFPFISTSSLVSRKLSVRSWSVRFALVRLRRRHDCMHD